MDKLTELIEIEKSIDRNLKLYDDAMKKSLYNIASKHLELIDNLLNKMDENEVKLVTEKILN